MMHCANNPEFVLFTGPMFSGKSTSLFVALEKHKYQKRSIVVFKPQIDVRYADSEIVSHNNLRYPAVSISCGADIISYLTTHDVTPQTIAVDEAFMLPGIAETLIWLYKSGVSVIVSSLDISASGKVFDEVKEMLPWATRVEKCTAVCTVCGADAQFTHKKVVNEEEVEVGGVELYEARCMTHHAAIQNLT